MISPLNVSMHYTVMDRQFDDSITVKESTYFANAAMRMDMQHVRAEEARDAVKHLRENFAGRAISFNTLYSKSGLDDVCLRLAIALMVEKGYAHGEHPYKNREYHKEYYLIVQ